MRRSVLSAAAAAVLALSTTYASADNVDLTGFTFNPASLLTVTSVAPGPAISDVDIKAGQFTGLLNGNSFTTYCTELTQGFSFNTLYTDYGVVNGLTAFGATKSLQLDELMSAVAAVGYPIDADTSALVQAAIWEIIYETGPTLSFTSGTLTVSSSNAATQLALGGINFGGLSSVPVTVHVNQLHSPTAQDFLVLTPVPEPSTYALMLAGIVGMGFVARRRTQQR